MDLVEQVCIFGLSNIHTFEPNISVIRLFSLMLNYAKLRLLYVSLTNDPDWKPTLKTTGGIWLFPNWMFLPTGQMAEEIFKNTPTYARGWTCNLWLMRPELFHKTNLACESEGCWSLCSTKHVQSFAIWLWAVNSANLEKCWLK